MQCVILAGGLGTRMWPVAKTIPKTLLPVAGRPFASWQLAWLASAGVESIVYSIGHRGEQIRDYVGDGSAWGLSIAYVDDGDHLRGTAGALALAVDVGVLDERFLVLYGDSWLRIDPADVLGASIRCGLPALMTVYDNRGKWDGSNVEYDIATERVTRYQKGLDPPPAQMHWIDYGLSAFTRDVIDTRVSRSGLQDLANLYTALAASGELAGHQAYERFYEIGSPDGLREADQLLRRDGS